MGLVCGTAGVREQGIGTARSSRNVGAPGRLQAYWSGSGDRMMNPWPAGQSAKSWSIRDGAWMRGVRPANTVLDSHGLMSSKRRATPWPKAETTLPLQEIYDGVEFRPEPEDGVTE